MALVIVVDDAVIDVRNLAERLRRRTEAGGGAPAWRTVIDASLEMRGAMLNAGLIVLALLLPAFFLAGGSGGFLPSLAPSYPLPVRVSMVVALTFPPALGMMLLSNAPAERRVSPVI